MQIYANVRYVSKSLLVLIFVKDLKKDRNKKKLATLSNEFMNIMLFLFNFHCKQASFGACHVGSGLTPFL